jgi:hypothetical protein
VRPSGPAPAPWAQLARERLERLERAPPEPGELRADLVDRSRTVLAEVRDALPEGDPLRPVVYLLRAELLRRQVLR